MNTLLQNIADKNLKALEENLSKCDAQELQTINQKCENFKSLAIKTLNDKEFEDFCRILKNFYAQKKIGPKI